MRFLLIVLAVLPIISCNTLFSDDKIAYEPLENFRPKEVTPPAEGFILVNSAPCVDILGEAGACTIKLERGGELVISIPPKGYNYKTSIVCSKGITSKAIGEWDVKKDTSLEIKVGPNDYSGSDSFVCLGEIFPSDRVMSNHMWEVRVRVEEMGHKLHVNFYKKKGKIFAILGQHALYSMVYDMGTLITYYKVTEVEIKKPDDAFIIVETYNGRLYTYIGPSIR